MHTNYNLTTIYTPVDADQLERLLQLTDYDPVEIEYLVQGFRMGFNFHYEGPTDRKDMSVNSF